MLVAGMCIQARICQLAHQGLLGALACEGNARSKAPTVHDTYLKCTDNPSNVWGTTYPADCEAKPVILNHQIRFLFREPSGQSLGEVEVPTNTRERGA